MSLGSRHADDLRGQIERLGPWFHNLHLPGGVQTRPDHYFGDFPRFKWQQIAGAIPAELRGWRALDVGCNAGFYSFELARRGADVTAIDLDEHYLAQARWAAARMPGGDRVSFRNQQVYHLAAQTEPYDLVLFMGVLYHLRYPTLAMDILARLTGRMMIFQSLTTAEEEALEPSANVWISERDKLRQPGWPKMAFIEHRFENDPTNWWVPNAACMEALVRSANMRVTARPGPEIVVCQPTGQQPTDLMQAEYNAAVSISAGWAANTPPAQ
jgi:tRNA (mo5U34)-methyltransferase